MVLRRKSPLTVKFGTKAMVKLPRSTTLRKVRILKPGKTTSLVSLTQGKKRFISNVPNKILKPTLFPKRRKKI